MPITLRATVLAVALLASGPLLAAGSGATTVGPDVSTQETQMTGQDDCWLSRRSSTDLPAEQAGFLPKPGITSPDSVEFDRHLSNAASCGRPLGFWNDESEDGVSPKRDYSAIAMPPRTVFPDLGKALFWKAYLMQTIFVKPGLRF